MTANEIPVFEVTTIADSTTIVIVGDGIDQLKDGEQLYILAVGEGVVPKTTAPFVMPKATVEVTFAAGVYAVVRPPTETQELPNAFSSFAVNLGLPKSTTTRPKLNVDEKQTTGMPSRQIKVGDAVIRVKDLAQYIKQRGGYIERR